jgi:hypothetical protein
MKTANKIYKEYKKGGGTLTFKEWIDREKKKGFVNFEGSSFAPTNKPLTDSINATLENVHKQFGYQTKLENEYIFGLDRNLLIGAGVLAVVIGGIIIYHKTHKK